MLRDKGLADLHLVLHSCRVRRGLQGTEKQERCYLAVSRFLNDPTTRPHRRSDYRAWRAADEGRRQTYPSDGFIVNAFGGRWENALSAVASARFEPLLRRKSAVGGERGKEELRAWCDEWLASLPEDCKPKREDFTAFLAGFRKTPHATLGRAPSWDPFRRVFKSWQGLLDDRGVARLTKSGGVPVSSTPRAGTLQEQTEMLLAAAAKLGRHLSYPQYDRWRAHNAADWLERTGKPLLTSMTLKTHLGNGSWLQAKVTVGLISQSEADAGRTRLKHSDDEVLDVFRLFLREMDQSRAAYNRWRGTFERTQAELGEDSWAPSDASLLRRFGGEGAEWELVIAAGMRSRDRDR
jgi:hypothetical protein